MLYLTMQDCGLCRNGRSLVRYYNWRVETIRIHDKHSYTNLVKKQVSFGNTYSLLNATIYECEYETYKKCFQQASVSVYFKVTLALVLHLSSNVNSKPFLFQRWMVILSLSFLTNEQKFHVQPLYWYMSVYIYINQLSLKPLKPVISVWWVKYIHIHLGLFLCLSVLHVL